MRRGIVKIIHDAFKVDTHTVEAFLFSLKKERGGGDQKKKWGVKPLERLRKKSEGCTILRKGGRSR
jgi:hypothetical protein